MSPLHILYIFLFMIYTIVLFGFGGYIKIIEIVDLFNCFACKEMNELKNSYDYIIVGCGSAGSVVAQRLVEEKHTTVLLLEAGPNSGTLFDIPAIGPLLQQSSIDWKYKTVPQKKAARGLHKQANNWPMGRAIGGTGRLNNMVYMRGHPKDFQEWFKDDPNFNNYKKDILSYFKKSENQKGSYLNDTVYHSTNGPLIVEDLNFVSPLAKVILEAAKNLGYPIRDLNSEFNTGFMQTQANINSGVRWTPAEHLFKNHKTNLVLQTNTLVHKILFKSDYEAYGVKYTYLSQTLTVQARKGIILSAGVIGTPKLLMLSGIGPKKHLNKTGIITKINLPVGNNLQDHVTTGTDLIMLNTSLGIGFTSMLSPFSAFNYFFESSGPWTSVGCEVVAVINTKNQTSCYKNKIKQHLPTARRYKIPKTNTNIDLEITKNEKCIIVDDNNNHQPDLELMVIPVGVSSDGGHHFKNAFGFRNKIWNKYFAPLFDKTTISILPIVLHPKSRGTVRLTDKNIYSQPKIDPNYLSDPYDVKILLNGINLIKKIIATKPMQKLGAKLNEQKFPGCENFIFDTDPYWECYVRHLTLTAYHPVGTCKMGSATDQKSVVDYNFQVLGTNKLYVVDASVMPTLTSGNPNAAVVMLAEKAADVIKYHNYLNTGTCQRKEIFLPKNKCVQIKSFQDSTNKSNRN